jgi:hypothetical protein
MKRQRKTKTKGQSSQTFSQKFITLHTASPSLERLQAATKLLRRSHLLVTQVETSLRSYPALVSSETPVLWETFANINRQLTELRLSIGRDIKFRVACQRLRKIWENSDQTYVSFLARLLYMRSNQTHPSKDAAQRKVK